jgi:DNA-binding SARP family transcriptional activator
VNLELYGAIALRGEDSEADAGEGLDALRGLALQLATAPWVEVAEVVVVGGPASLAELEHVRTEATLAEAFPTLWQAHASTRRSLAARGFSSVHEARLREDDPCWWPTVVLVADGAEPEGLRELAKLAKPGSGLVAVVPTPSPGFSALPAAGGEPGVAVDDPTLDSLVELVQTVSDAADVSPDAAPYDQLGPVRRTRIAPVTQAETSSRATASPLGSSAAGPTRDASTRAERPEVGAEAAVETAARGHREGIQPVGDPMPGSDGRSVGAPDRSPVVGTGRSPEPAGGDEGVEVRILGPVEVTGAALPPRGARVLELLAYLAVHPAGTRTEQWETALWLDQRPSAGARRNLLYQARRCLGSASDGASHVVVEAGSARLGPEVGTDWARFRQLTEDPANWRAALELVRGRPLGGIGEASWALTEGHLATIEAEVLDLALGLAERALANDEPDLAEWAARRGLSVSPWDERLYRAWMRAADGAGRRATVEAAWRQLNGILQVDGDGTESPELETVELYRSLRGAARDPSMTP